MLLVVGIGDHKELAIKKLIETGMTIALLDLERNTKYSRFFHKRIFINPRDMGQQKKIIKAVTELNQEETIIGVLTLDELSVPMATIIAEVLKLPSNSLKTAEIVRNKYLMRKVFQEANLLTPQFSPVKTIEKLYEFASKTDNPFILKPTDSGGSAGVQLIDKNTDLEQAFEHSLKSSKTKLLIIEEFIHGKEYSVEAIVFNSQVNIVGITEKKTTEGPFFIELGHIFPAQLPEEINELFKETTIKAVQATGIQQGAVHLELKLTERGPIIIEIGGRIAGDFIPDLIEISTGIDMYTALISCSIGKDPSQHLLPKRNNFTSINFITSSPGYIQDIPFISELECNKVIDCYIGAKEGDFADVASANWKRLGYVIHKSDSYDDLKITIEHWEKQFKILTV